MTLDQAIVKEIVRQALAEDIGTGDATSASLVPPTAQGGADIVARSAGVAAGLPIAVEVFRQLSPKVTARPLVSEGEMTAAGARWMRVEGPARALLAGERTALNILQRLGGIATLTRRCVETVRAQGTKILDTRKTTPGLRHLEKYAVSVGGGVNHRIGLFDQVLIKDNHLRMLLPECGDLPSAVKLGVRRARERFGSTLKIEVEAETLAMVAAAIEAEADIIMLDNMTLDQMRQAVQLVRAWREPRGLATPTTEASGGVRPERLAEVAATGVDAISLGALTHSAPTLDIGMDFDE